MKTLILKRKALALSWALATVLALAFTQCKKEETPAVTPTDDTTETPTNAPILPQGETVHITLKVNQNNDMKLEVNPPHVNFENGDTLYVASNGVYVGYLLYVGSNSEFVGDITGATAGQPLYFYLLGNRGVNGISWTVANEVTTGCSLDISNQHDYFAGQPANKQLPVVSCAPSNEDFAAGAAAQDFTAILCNQCALVKFNTNVISGKVTLGNMYNKANVNFATHTITPATTTGDISFTTDANGVGWAILLPHDGAITSTASAAGYGPASVTIPTINNNDYVSWGITVNLYNPLATPLTFVATTDGVNVGLNQTGPNLQYSKNGGDWTDYSAAITLNTNETVAFRGNNTDFGQKRFTCSGLCYIYGNVTSLLHAEDYATNYELAENAFAHLFESNTNIDIHPEKDLVLPATTLAASCYNSMFRSCSALTKVPNLPAAVLPQQCYAHMFRQSGLDIVPADMMINATTMSYQSCVSMFRECPNLTNAPTIAATTVGEESCNAMFYQSAKLASVSFTLPATTLAYRCYYNMFNGCTQLASVPSDMLPAETLADNCYEIMFRGCTNLTAAPELPATTLVSNCYNNMFDGCKSLNSVTCLATSGINQNGSTSNWLYNAGNNVTGTKTVYTASAATWPTNSANGIPSGWTRVNSD